MHSDDDDGLGAVDAPGWAALDRHFQAWFRGVTPHQFTSTRPYELDGHSPLPAVMVWPSDEPRTWLYVGYGLSELFEKSSPLDDTSGFGVELVMRIPRAPLPPGGSLDDEVPPQWPVTLIQMLGHYVLSRRSGFDSGHVIDLGGPIDRGETALTAIVCVPDPVVAPLEGPFGRVLFLNLVGLHADELAVVKDLELGAQMGLVVDANPKAITDPARASWLTDEQAAPIVRRYKLGIGKL
jgi:hypothetical protein